MKVPWQLLSLTERRAFQAAAIFIEPRLEDKAALEWALASDGHERSKRLAVQEVVERAAVKGLREPWLGAWRLVIDSWHHQEIDEDLELHNIQSRMKRGIRSGVIVSDIVHLVSPRVTVAVASKALRKPRSIEDLLIARLTSGSVVNPRELSLREEADASFLVSLAGGLDASLTQTIDTARRIGWKGERHDGRTGQLNRVYFVANPERGRRDADEADAFNEGIAPTVKLLFASVERLADLNLAIARRFAESWKSANDPIRTRMWCALARHSSIAAPEEVGDFLLSAPDALFWGVNTFPEFTELRAVRFRDLAEDVRGKIARRIRKGPPARTWPSDTSPDRVAKARLYWVLRELRRIELAGGTLPANNAEWLRTNLRHIPELNAMDRIDFDFMGTEGRTIRAIGPDASFDELNGAQLLIALEEALSTPRRDWRDDPEQGARVWLAAPGSKTAVMAALREGTVSPSELPFFWETFSWVHSSNNNPNADKEANTVIKSLAAASDDTLRSAIEGISFWMGSWAHQVLAHPDGILLWQRLWPLAVAATNARSDSDEVFSLDTASPEDEPKELDTLNGPVGRLIDVFFAALNDRRRDEPAFSAGSILRTMRDHLEMAGGRAGLIVRHRLIEQLTFFLNLDRQWTEQRLITPLEGNTQEALTLWTAVARRTQFEGVLKVIGRLMVERATDRRLKRRVRTAFAFSLVVECLHALREKRVPAVPLARVQQMLRSLEDEVRAQAAEAVVRFMKDVSAGEKGPDAAEALFTWAVKPFLLEVWPKEHGLATPGVSRALAELPAASGAKFAEAADLIRPFLVPFECWSMIDYGLYGEEEDHLPKLSRVDDAKKAAALLDVLDLTIGKSDGAVVPSDLAAALQQIEDHAPKLATSRAYRRLKAQARR